MEHAETSLKSSVVVTTYNRPDALEKVLDALGHQVRMPDEILIADDGSGEETARVITRYSHRYPGNLYHIWHEDRGFRASKIRNEAIERAMGSYIILLDGDCIPDTYFVKDHMTLAKRGFFFQGKRVLLNSTRSRSFTFREVNTFLARFKLMLSGNISNRHHLLRLPFFPCRSSTSHHGIRSCNMGFFRDDIVAVNGFNQDFIGWGREDSELVVRFYKYGLKRNEQPFMATCFHLWHEENDRKRLAFNEELLRRAMISDGYVCANGLAQRQERTF